MTGWLGGWLGGWLARWLGGWAAGWVDPPPWVAGRWLDLLKKFCVGHIIMVMRSC